MANWISSKLKAAESLLQQIDQQAADSLGKSEKARVDGVSFDSPTKPESSVPLKDQLKKKPLESNNDYRGKFPSDRILNSVNSSSRGSKDESFSLHKEGFVSPKQPSPKPKTTLTDNDWTQLLSTPTAPSSGVSARVNGVSGIRGPRKDQRRQVDSGSGSSVTEGRRNQRGSNGGLKASRKVRGLEGKKVNGKTSDGDELGFSDSSGVKAPNDVRYAKGRESDDKEIGGIRPATKQVDKGNERNDGPFDYTDLALKASSQSHNSDSTLKKVPTSGNIDEVSEAKMKVVDTLDRVRSTVVAEKHETRTVASRSSTSDDLKRGSSSVSYQSSDSDSGSGSSSDSEVEREREERRRRREKLLAEKAAAKAAEAIKEKENLIARLEGEKQSLEKIFEEQTKQQAQEASKLQTSMMETMEAVELEKQKHNNTRMEVLALLAKLETANVELARSLATMQWDLEVEVDRVTELRQQIDLKEAKNEELRRKISDAHQTGMKNTTALKGSEIEQEILEAEYTLLTDKVRKLQDKAKKVEADIEITRKEIEEPTEVEVELKRRLNQMTDHLIQKQTQVESLSSEKATIQFRIEAVTRMLEENKSMADYAVTTSRDLESGIWNLSDSKLKFKDKIRSSQKHLYSLLQQFDSIFLAGAVFLRRNPTAKLWSLVYLLCLHFWVVYILMSHSQPSYESKSGAVFSLENINNASTT